MLYPELFKSMEAVRWSMAHDIPWTTLTAASLPMSKLTPLK